MADLSVTPANVLIGAGGNQAQGVAGTTIAQGDVLYIDTANNNVLKLADANAVAPANVVAGIALTAGSVGQPVLYGVSAPAFILGATLAAGDTIWLSATPGKMTKTFADLISGDLIVVMGVATSTTAVNLAPLTGGTIA